LFIIYLLIFAEPKTFKNELDYGKTKVFCFVADAFRMRTLHGLGAAGKVPSQGRAN
jgi:hypothetical protein